MFTVFSYIVSLSVKTKRWNVVAFFLSISNLEMVSWNIETLQARSYIGNFALYNAVTALISTLTLPAYIYRRNVIKSSLGSTLVRLIAKISKTQMQILSRDNIAT